MKFNICIFLLCFVSLVDCASLKTERTSLYDEDELSLSSQRIKYNFKDLMEAGDILLKQRQYGKSQELFELALEMQPKNLDIFKRLAKIYEITEQTDRMAMIAESVSSYLLPESEEDLFYEKMLTLSISLNSKNKPKFAWATFLRLKNSMIKKPGRFTALIKKLEMSVYVPFLAKIYRYLQQNSDYDGFLWGKLGEYYLSKNAHDQADKFLRLEFRKCKFDRRLLYAYALVMLERKYYALCQVYVNLARRLVKDKTVLGNVEDLQLSLSEHIYEIGEKQVRTEADLLFKFGETEAGLERLKELVLLSVNNPETWYEMGTLLLSYPKDYNTWEFGKDYLFNYMKMTKATFNRYLDICKILFERKYLNELVLVLNKIQKDYEKEYEYSTRLIGFKKTVTEELLKNIRLFEMYSSLSELKTYLKFLIQFDPNSLEGHKKLSRLYLREVEEELAKRKFLSDKLQMELQEFVLNMETTVMLKFSDEEELYYLAGRLFSSFSKKNRQYSREISYYRDALTLAPNYVEAGYWLAKSFYDFEFYRRSITKLDEIFVFFEVGDEELQQKAVQLYIENDLKLAEQAYGTNNYFLVIERMLDAVARNNNKLVNLESTLWLGYSYVYTEDHSANKKLMSLALKEWPDETQLLYLQALALEGLNDHEVAVSVYEKIIKKGPPEDEFVKECVKNKANLELIIKYKNEEKESLED